MLRKIRTSASYPVARTIVELKGAYQWIKSFNKKVKIHFELNYSGQPIMLLALYQKGCLRHDLIRLLRIAKAQNLYVVGVNTLELQEPEALQGLVDCYIERPNFGRDFGSYKVGFLHCFKRHWVDSCPRLIMVNDSVFYASRGLENFIKDLSVSQVEVLGATENYEIEHHLGSFCISMAQSVLTSARFKAFWKNYRLTDTRPVVIRRGEMKLSRTLKRCVSSPLQFRALYDSSRYLSELKSNSSMLELIIRDSRTSDKVDWPAFNPTSVAEFFSNRFVVRKFNAQENITIDANASVEKMHEDLLIFEANDLERYILRHVSEGAKLFDEIFRDVIASIAVENFSAGSQIHQNAALLLEAGLPIIKLDGLYRGAFNHYDILRICRKLKDSESIELKALLFNRPYGGATLRGWQLVAFYKGLI